ncbi:MAG TPA: DUF455 family protein [Stellaceae bacterium]|nr:DUF455 family protein [Stellaceae bacterium]
MNDIAIDTIEVRGIRLRRDPAREPCYKVVRLLTEMRSAGIETPEALREFIHRDINNEVQSTEIAAQMLVDFPDAPWELRMCLARQCWDETRHAWLYVRRLKELGGYRGEFPITNSEWGVTCLFKSLPARLAIQNRAFEAGSLDVFYKMAKAFRDKGDERSAELTEAVLNDEIQHVRFANHWIKQMVQANPRALLEIAAAVDEVNRIMRAMTPQEGEYSIDGVALAAVGRPNFDINVPDRALAAFSGEELEAMLRKEEERRVWEAEERRKYLEQTRLEAQMRSQELAGAGPSDP